jgi:hypothetical protein
VSGIRSFGSALDDDFLMVAELLASMEKQTEELRGLALDNLLTTVPVMFALLGAGWDPSLKEEPERPHWSEAR